MPTTSRSGNRPDVEIRVAGRKAKIFEIDRRRHGERLHAQRPPILVFHRFQQRVIFLQCAVVCVFRIILHDGHDRRRVHEAREIVHVAVGVVAGDSVFQPKNIRHAEIFAEDLRVVFFPESRISFLLFAEQTFFCG